MIEYIYPRSRSGSIQEAGLAKYLIAPYLLQVKPRSTRRAQALPTDNIDGSNLPLSAALGNVFASMLNREQPYLDPYDADKKYSLTKVKCADGEAFLVHLEPGWKGLASTIRSGNTPRYTRDVEDTEHVALRHLVFFPSQGYSAIVLAERYGRMGAISFLRNALYSAFSKALPHITLSLEPLTTMAALETAMVRRFEFRAPKRRDPTGKLLDFSPTVRIIVGFKDRLAARRLLKDGVVDRGTVFGIMGEQLERDGAAAPAHNEDWDALMTVKTASGSARTFSISSSGPGIVYPVQETLVELGIRNVGQGGYPTDDEFVRVCQTALRDFSGSHGIGDAAQLPDIGHFTTWDGSSVSSPWDVTYYDNPSPSGNP